MTVTTINLILTSIITVLSIWAFMKRRSDVALYKHGGSEASASVKAIAIPQVSLYIGIAFGLFAVSHALTRAGLGDSLESFIITIRIIGYLLVMVAPLRILMRK